MTTLTRAIRRLWQVWLSCKHTPPVFSQYEDLAPQVGDNMYCVHCHGVSQIVSVARVS